MTSGIPSTGLSTLPPTYVLRTCLSDVSGRVEESQTSALNETSQEEVIQTRARNRQLILDSDDDRSSSVSEGNDLSPHTVSYLLDDDFDI